MKLGGSASVTFSSIRLWRSPRLQYSVTRTRLPSRTIVSLCFSTLGCFSICRKYASCTTLDTCWPLSGICQPKHHMQTCRPRLNNRPACVSIQQQVLWLLFRVRSHILQIERQDGLLVDVYKMRWRITRFAENENMSKGSGTLPSHLFCFRIISTEKLLATWFVGLGNPAPPSR